MLVYTVMLVATRISSLLADFAAHASTAHPTPARFARRPSPSRGGCEPALERVSLPMVGEVRPESNLGAGALW